VLAFHRNWFYVAVVVTGLVGLWGVVLAVLRREPPPVFRPATWLAIGVMLVQVGAGLWLYGRGLEPSDGFHMFYGIVIAITFSLAYLWRSTMAQRPALSYGLLLLFVMGLGLRAWANVG
jgi:heme A synthase